MSKSAAMPASGSQQQQTLQQLQLSGQLLAQPARPAGGHSTVAPGGNSKPKAGGAAATIAKRFSRTFQGVGGGGNQQQQQQQQQQQKKAGHHHQKQQQQQQPPIQTQLVSSVPIMSRVYILGSTDDSKRVTIKEVMYADMSKSKNFSKAAAGSRGRPFWVPESIQHGCWAVDPPCFWKLDSFALQDLESGSLKLMYNPMEDYSLELMLHYRLDLFENLFHLFSVCYKRTYSSRQLQQLKDLIKPNLLRVEDLDANFNPSSPVAGTLKRATLTEDILPEIEHYLVLLSVKAYRLRDHLGGF